MWSERSIARHLRTSRFGRRLVLINLINSITNTMKGSPTIAAPMPGALTLSKEMVTITASSAGCEPIAIGSFREADRQGEAMQVKASSERATICRRRWTSSMPTSTATTWRPIGWSIAASSMTKTPGHAGRKAIPFIWTYKDQIEPLLYRSAELITTETSERRSLVLVNPGLAPQRATRHDPVCRLSPERSRRDHAAAPAFARTRSASASPAPRISPASRARTSPSAPATWC